jgi:N utilization substance protein B
MWDFRGIPIDDALNDYYSCLYSAETEEETGIEQAPPAERDPFMEALARGTATQAAEIDELIRKRAEHWRLERMPRPDRNILRMAIYEMKAEATPPAVVIDEALELARRYSEEEAVPFINGVLDSVRRLIHPETVPSSP